MSVVGIDLGTTNTVVGCVRSGKVHVLADERGVRLLPSVVSFHPNGEVLVGAAAKARRVIDPRSTVYSHKRLIGRSWGSPEIAEARQRFAFELREGPGQGPLVHARGRDYTLPEVSAFVLKRVRQIAEQALGTPVDRAVITVPAHFNELQRASTKVAGRVSGLEVLRILNEPTAAALAYGLGRTGNERVAVYDFGGGTFDCTLLDLSGNVFEVLATAGDSFLGGDDVDGLIADRMADVFLKQSRIDARQDPQAFERLKQAAEEVKIALSTAENHTITLSDFAPGAGGSSLAFTFSLTRGELDAMVAPLVDRTFQVTEDALGLARLTPTSFDKIILVGGSTRIPMVRQRVERFFGKKALDRVNPDEVVAIGAAIQAAALTESQRRRSLPEPPFLASPATIPTPPLREDDVVTKPGAFAMDDDADAPTLTNAPVRPVSRPADTERGNIGERTHTMAALQIPAQALPSSPPPDPSAGRTSRMPAVPPPLPDPHKVGPRDPSSRGLPRASTTAPMPISPRTPATAPMPAFGVQQPFPSSASLPAVRPPEPVVAAPILVDVTPRALIVETAGGFSDTIIPRNSKIPCERTRRFTTSRDGQTTVRVRVAQGETTQFAENTFLGEIQLSGLRAATRGEVTVAVTFEVDADATLRVRARDVQSGHEAQATLRLVGVADEAAIQMMANRFATQTVGGGTS